jgi:flagellar motor switch protein FliG
MAVSAQATRLASTRGLQGSDRVAAILLTMGKALAGRLMKHFEPEEIRQITRSAADLKAVPAPQLGALIEEFATQFAVGASLVGNPADVERLLEGVLPKEQIDEIMGDIAGSPDRSIWDRISAASEGALASFVLKEHPQTAALILSRVKPATAAKVIGHLPPARRDSLVRRMLTVKPIVDESMRLLERILHQEFTANFASNAGSEGQARLAEIINKLDRELMDQVLQSLAATRPKAAESLKGMMFTFDDIGRLSQRARGTLMDKVPADKVALSLKGTPAEFRELILSSLSSRVRKMIEQELNNGQPVPARDVNDARRTVTDLALDLAGRGEIEIRTEGEDGDLIT